MKKTKKDTVVASSDECLNQEPGDSPFWAIRGSSLQKVVLRLARVDAQKLLIDRVWEPR